MFNYAISKKFMKQITNSILMISPVNFRGNEQTAINNYYQNTFNNSSFHNIQQNALVEFNNLVDKLKSAGVNVIVIRDTNELDTPDSIFPNNWVSFHENGKIVLYPMFAKNRRKERRQDILDFLVDYHNFRIEEIKDFTNFENYNKYLEGTGSMVLDREDKICYAAISIRTAEDIVIKFSKDFGYKSVCFVANQDVHGDRKPIYHTNVMMCVTDKFAVICLDAIDDKREREYVVKMLNKTGKEIIEITQEQKHRFAGNMLQVMGDRSYLVMSSSAFNILSNRQIKAIQKYCPIIHSPLDTIEAFGGGSARCMMAEIFLPKE